jgi:hypothetical protein
MWVDERPFIINDKSKSVKGNGEIGGRSVSQEDETLHSAVYSPLYVSFKNRHSGVKKGNVIPHINDDSDGDMLKKRGIFIPTPVLDGDFNQYVGRIISYNEEKIKEEEPKVMIEEELKKTDEKVDEKVTHKRFSEILKQFADDKDVDDKDVDDNDEGKGEKKEKVNKKNKRGKIEEEEDENLRLLAKKIKRQRGKSEEKEEEGQKKLRTEDISDLKGLTEENLRKLDLLLMIDDEMETSKYVEKKDDDDGDDGTSCMDDDDNNDKDDHDYNDDFVSEEGGEDYD